MPQRAGRGEWALGPLAGVWPVAFSPTAAGPMYAVDMRIAIRVKLLGAFGVVAALMLVVGLFAVHRLGGENQQQSVMAVRVVPATRTVGEISDLLNRYRADQFDYILAGTADRPGPTGIDGNLSGDLSLMRRVLSTYRDDGLASGRDDSELLKTFAADFASYVAQTAPFARSLMPANGSRPARSLVTAPETRSTASSSR